MRAARDRTTLATRSCDAPGFAVRCLAADILECVLYRRRALDEILDSTTELATLAERDRALTRALAATVLRRLGTLRHVLGLFSTTVCRGKRHGSRPRCYSVQRKFFFSTCRIMPPSILRFALRKRIRAPPDLPV